MSMKLFRSSPIAIKLNEQSRDGSLNEPHVPQDVQILKIGTFTHPEYGKFKITLADLQKMKSNFYAKVRGVDLAIDYAHESEKVAAGWFTDIYLSEDETELWAKISWNAAGKKVLAEREYRYLSADFSFSFENNETGQEFGPTLFGAGLTNRPCIKNMAPVIELSESKENEMNEEQLKAEIKKLSEKIEGMESEKKKLDDSLAGMTPEQLMEKIKELEAEISKLKGESEVVANEKKLAEQKGQFDKLLSEGKACEAQRESFMKGDTIKFAELASDVNLSDKGNAGSGNGAETGGAEEQVMVLAEKMIADKKASDIGAAISTVLSENQELRKKYESK